MLLLFTRHSFFKGRQDAGQLPPKEILYKAGSFFRDASVHFYSCQPIIVYQSKLKLAANETDIQSKTRFCDVIYYLPIVYRVQQ
jgi:hypothetical protein